MRKLAMLVTLAISVIFTGCAAPNYGSYNGPSSASAPFGFRANPILPRSVSNSYRANPTYNYPTRGYDGTIAGAEAQGRWAQTEQQWAQADMERARAAREWSRIDTDRAREEAYAAREKARTVQEYAYAAREVTSTVRDIANAFRGRRW